MKTFAYECVVTKDELYSKRQEFWGNISGNILETRVNGNPEIWKAIRCAVVEPNCTINNNNRESRKSNTYSKQNSHAEQLNSNVCGYSNE